MRSRIEPNKQPGQFAGRAAWALSLILLSSILAPHSTAEDLVPSEVEKLLRAFREEQPSQLVIRLKEDGGNNYTVATESQSAQPGNRAVFFPRTGQLAIGLNADASSMEIAFDTETARGVLPYKIVRSGDGHRLVSSNSCVACHSPEFTYIFPQYRMWSGFLGERDDEQDPHSENFTKMRTHSMFSELFRQKSEIREHNPAFPYYSFRFTRDDLPRRLSRMPNTQFTLMLAKRSADNTFRKIQSIYPERWNRLKEILMFKLLCRRAFETAPQKSRRDEVIWQYLSRELQTYLPENAQKWEAVRVAHTKRVNTESGAGVISGDEVEMAILNILGVPPYSIILTEPWNERNPLSSPKEYAEFMSQYDKKPGQYGSLRPIGERAGISGLSPLDYETGFVTLGEYLGLRILETQGTDVYRIEKSAGYKEELLGSSDEFVDLVNNFSARIVPEYKCSEEEFQSALSALKKKWADSASETRAQPSSQEAGTHRHPQ